MKKIFDIINLIDNWLKEDANNLLTFGWIIKDWYDKEIDEMRDFVNNANEWLNDYTKKIIKETSISNLRIKYTQASWYFIEIPLWQKSKVPENFTHKTTLVNALRYSTNELEAFDEKISNAQSFLYKKEYDVFKDISNKILEDFWEIKSYSSKITNIDFISNLAYIAYENDYVKPEINWNFDLEIISARHPIIEKIEKVFISNELFLNKKNYINIISWPNMWWKSTYLRQNALIILLAHMGSYIPAKSAKIPLVDKIFSRIWASDNQVLWASTFMVEMQEMANILNNATSKSFVIIDEVWRWTSTYDGMSLAWAILKELNDNIKSKTLLSTHYHELVIESKKLSWVKNFSIAVWENNDNIVFLRKIIPWWSSKSYWIEVAKLAWLPKSVILDANSFLQNFEKQNKFSQMSLWSFWEQKEKIIYKESEIENKLKTIDVNNLTPIEALNLLNELKGM